jgi:type IV secretion system protein VirB11
MALEQINSNALSSAAGLPAGLNPDAYERKQTEAYETLMRVIKGGLGSNIIDALQDDDVTDIMINSDGMLWVDKFGSGMSFIGRTTPSQVHMALMGIAGALNLPLSPTCPSIEGEFPVDGSRFIGAIPPIVRNPILDLRKKPKRLIPFGKYVADGNLAPEALALLEDLITTRKNVLIAGGTGSGKTTFANAVIEAISRLTPDDRLLIVEDTQELQSASPNRVELKTLGKDWNMEKLLEMCLRLRPDRILVGEVRNGKAAGTMLSSWNTGHEGGICTVHANNAEETMSRVEDMIRMAGQVPVRQFMAQAIHYIVYMKKEIGVRRVTEIIKVNYSKEKDEFKYDWEYRWIPIEEQRGLTAGEGV